MNYIWFNYETPILQQLPHPFTEAAILLNPFIQMPEGWTDKKKKNEYEHVYPEFVESLQHGSPKPWKQVMSDTGIQSYAELAVALKLLRYGKSSLVMWAVLLLHGFPQP